ncbi:SDR family NAD(P)-dependent oxidoreductase [Bacillus sp. FJAT-45037]|uniref:SDR family NAD(P)-dependent oxidoreductase n=1 Tax=Bacillus sp. FJAT-45037 TaxID=2011007 RepID=UPI002FCDB356
MKTTALITGASDGIGLELAKEFATHGHDLVIVARSEDKLTKLSTSIQNDYDVKVTIIKKDLSKLGSVKELHEEISELNIQVDFLVNNAGFGLYGEFTKTNLDEELSMIDLNIRTLTELTKRFSPDMISRGYGGILNVASIAAFMPGPLMAVYYATKAYVLSFSEALDEEFKGTGVYVSCLCPGPTNTGFVKRAQLESSKLFNQGAMDVSEVSSLAFNSFMKKKTIIIPGLQNKALSSLVRLLPRKTVRKIVKKAQARL